MAIIKTFNRAKAFGLLLLLSLAVVAAGISYWQQFWWAQTITARNTNGTIVSVTKVGLLTARNTVTTYDNNGNQVSVVSDNTFNWHSIAVDAGACDMNCKLMYIAGPLQIAATAVGLATWTLWFGIMFFNKLKHGILATVGIWVMSLLQAAAIALWVYATNGRFRAEVSSPDPTYAITNVYTFYDYSFALSCGSIGWCWLIIAPYIMLLKAKAKNHGGLNSISPSAPADNKSITKTAAWVV